MNKKEKAREYYKLRCARLLIARKKGTHSKGQWLAMLSINGSLCPRCNNVSHRLFKDHIIPIYQGGSDSIDNIQPLCPRCSSAKGPESIDHRNQSLASWAKKNKQLP